MRIANHAAMLTINTMLANGPSSIHPVMVWDEHNAVLIDAGMPQMKEQMRQSAEATGAPFDRINRLLITHSDLDHIGCVAQIVRESNQTVTVYAHQHEKQYIECQVPPLRLQQMEEGIEKATGVLRDQLIAVADDLKRNYRSYRATVNETVDDGSTLPFCGGIVCIHTPGHSPGHVSYFIVQERLLVAGDILQTKDGKLVKCPDIFTMDRQALAASLRKLAQYEIETVICYHGGLVRGDVSRQIAQIADGM